MDFNFLEARAAITAKDAAALEFALATVSWPAAWTPESLAHALLAWPSTPFPATDVRSCFRLSIKAAELQALQAKQIFHPAANIPRGLDFIADIGGLADWAPDQVINRLLLDTVQPRRKAAVVGTMRDDGIYILEWVAHYRALGFEHLFVYTNDNADASDALLDCLASHGLVTVFRNEISGEVAPEAKAFGHALQLVPALRDFEWALFIDSDEFLIPAPIYQWSVRAILDALALRWPHGTVGGICYDWLWFVSDAVFERHPGTLYERFQHARPHWLTKCLVRPRDVLSMRRQHYPEMMPGYRFVDSAFHLLSEADMPGRRCAEYHGGQLNHYWPKSFQEFAVKKARGAILGGDDNLYDRPYTTFFQWNGPATRENHVPADPEMVRRVRAGIAELRALEGVATCADRIEQAFPQLVERASPAAQLRQHYFRNRVAPGDL